MSGGPDALQTLVLIDSTARARLQSDPAAYEDFLGREIAVLERAYRGGTPPRVIALAAQARHLAVEGIAPCPSASHARLTGLIGQMKIAGGGDARTMAEAESWLISAIAELCSLGDWTRERIALLTELVLNRAVSLKARGHTSDAADVLRSTMVDPSLRQYWAPGDTLPLVRQDVIMAGGLRPHRWLADQHDAIRAGGARERYRTVKRLLEFAMNHGRVSTSEALLKASIEAFKPIAEASSPLAKLSLVKNLGQFASLAGHNERALRVFEIAKRTAETHGLSGQLRQIDQMIAQVEAGERPLLNTFHAS